MKTSKRKDFFKSVLLLLLLITFIFSTLARILLVFMQHSVLHICNLPQLIGTNCWGAGLHQGHLAGYTSSGGSKMHSRHLSCRNCSRHYTNTLYKHNMLKMVYMVFSSPVSPHKKHVWVLSGGLNGLRPSNEYQHSVGNWAWAYKSLSLTAGCGLGHWIKTQAPKRVFHYNWGV